MSEKHLQNIHASTERSQEESDIDRRLRKRHAAVKAIKASDDYVHMLVLESTDQIQQLRFSRAENRT